jgi:UTP--glucose-1-phosphate uridylyltransferase
MSKTIRKAIIPVAGMGTRFLPATKAQPKEMLSVVDKPVIQYIVEEAVAAGIEEIIFVTAIGKRAIEDHFDQNFELEYRLAQKKKDKELQEIKDISDLAKIAFVRQHKPKGDGHALLAAAPFVDPDEPVAVLFGDDIIASGAPAIGQLIKAYDKYHNPIVAIQQVEHEKVSSYGVISGTSVEPGIWQVKSFVEKPDPKDAPTDLAVVGRYVITPEIFELLQTQASGKDGEIRLADCFMTFLRNGRCMYACEFEGKRYDCGNKAQYVIAQLALGLEHPEVRDELREYLKGLRPALEGEKSPSKKKEDKVIE